MLTAWSFISIYFSMYYYNRCSYKTSLHTLQDGFLYKMVFVKLENTSHRMQFPITYIGFPIVMVFGWIWIQVYFHRADFSQDGFSILPFFHLRGGPLVLVLCSIFNIIVLFQCWMYEHEQLDSCLSLKGLNTLNYRTV